MTTIEDAEREFYEGPRLNLTQPLRGPDEYPAPVVTSREAAPSGTVWPDAVLALQVRAAAAGWDTMRQYSRGRMPHATTGRPGPVKDWFCVRMRSADGSRAAYAIHDGTAWKSLCVWGGGLAPYMDIGVTELNEWIAGVPDPAAWVDSIRARRVEQECQRKLKAKERPKPAKSGEGL